MKVVSSFPVGEEHVPRYSAEQASNRSPQQIRDDPVFNPYPSSITNNVIPLLVRGAHLAQGIPSLTPAVGVTDLSSLLDMENDYDLNDGSAVNRPNGWPLRATYPGQWLHSDLKDVAFSFNYKFFDKIVEKGDLR